MFWSRLALNPIQRLIREMAAPAAIVPALTDIVPSDGSVLGGEVFTVNGTGFENSGETLTKVEFGVLGVYAEATGAEIQSDTEITGFTPAHVAGRVDVRVTFSVTGALTLSDVFTYA